MHFAYPEFLWLLIFVPVYLAVIIIWRNRQEAIGASVFEDLQEASKESKMMLYLEIVKKALIIIIFILFTITLARPQNVHEKQDVSKEGIDIILALDVSESMLAEDLSPNRLEAAKAGLKDFLNSFESDRLGIVIFAGQAFTQSPLTFDYGILNEFLDRISTDTVNQRVRGLSGTAIGNAILAAVNRFKQSEERSKVLILLTDGDANTGVDPQIAAQKAAQENIKIYTIGIGQEGGSPLYSYDLLGNKQYARNYDGSIVMATFNEEELKKLAQIGNGQYFRAGDNVAFHNVLEQINQLEKKEIVVNTITEYSENFMPYMSALLICLGLYVFLITYKIIIK